MAITDIYGINPNTGLPYQTPRTISDQNEFLGQTFTAPQLSFFDKTKNFIQDFPGNISTGVDKGFDLGKAAIGGIASLVTGIPGIGLLLNAFGPMTEEEKAMRDFYGDQFGLTDTGQVASGIMAGYNPVSMFGGPGLSKSIDKRIARINKTLDKQRKDKKRKESDVLKQRLKELQDLKEKDRLAKLGANRGIGGFDPSGPTQRSIREERGDLSGRGQRGGFTNPGKGSYGPYS